MDRTEKRTKTPKETTERLHQHTRPRVKGQERRAFQAGGWAEPGGRMESGERTAGQQEPSRWKPLGTQGQDRQDFCCTTGLHFPHSALPTDESKFKVC
jgi:hypothetical protein